MRISGFGGTKEMPNSAVLCAGTFKKILLNKKTVFEDGTVRSIGLETIKPYKITDKILKRNMNNIR